ncbi:MAG: acyl-CoA carboxylase subunit beta [Deltaproteobacteria bacterium]|nr:acyl-CoA carboxylase subunit beta [Deltaproteobacteria bacterium]
MSEHPGFEEFARRNSEMAVREEAEAEAGEESGALTARQRLELLFDEGSFQEIDRFVTHCCPDFGMEKKQTPGDAVITGSGMINGRLAHAYAHDFRVMGGTFSEANTKKICKVLDKAMHLGTPFIGLNDSGGSRIQEGVCGLAGVASLFLKNTLASGLIPQISAIMGPCAGGASYSPALTDFIVMVEGQSHMFVTGPEVIKAVTHENVSKEELGGARTHHQLSGVSHLVAADDKECIVLIRDLLEYIPANNLEESPVRKCFDDPRRREPLLNEFIPADSRTSYDVKELIRTVVDEGSFFEVQSGYAANLVVGFARLDGRAVGIVANQPAHLAGALDTDGSRKGARFVRFCDCFNIPLVTFVDVPGFLPGKEQELDGIIRDGAKLLFAYCEATVPKISLITRKAYGGAYCVMSSKHIRGDYNFAYPGAEIAVMGPEGAVNIIYRRELAQQKDEKFLREKLEEYRQRFANPYVAAARGYIDEIIMPEDTRWKLIMALDRLKTKMVKNPPKKHGNMPL